MPYKIKINNNDYEGAFFKKIPTAHYYHVGPYNKYPLWMTERYYKKNITMLRMAFELSNLSHDPRTKHGCIITDNTWRILSAGYNGYPAGMKDDELPKTAPDKYAWMIHSEENAIMQASQPLWSIPHTQAFVTGTPCNNCAMKLAQSGINIWHLADRQGTHLEDEKSSNNLYTLIEQKRILVIHYHLNEIFPEKLFVPEYFVDALKIWGGVVDCESHEWDNRTTEENRRWIINKLYTYQEL